MELELEQTRRYHPIKHESREAVLPCEVPCGGRFLMDDHTETEVTQAPGASTEHEQHGSGAGRVPSGPSLRYDLAAADKLRGSATWRERGQCSRTLVKHPDLRLVLITLKSGGGLHQHKTDRRVSVHTLDGHLQLSLPGEQTIDLPTGHVLVLDEGVPHDVAALEDSAFLLSLGGKPDATKGAA